MHECPVSQPSQHVEICVCLGTSEHMKVSVNAKHDSENTGFYLVFNGGTTV